MKYLLLLSLDAHNRVDYCGTTPLDYQVASDWTPFDSVHGSIHTHLPVSGRVGYVG